MPLPCRVWEGHLGQALAQAPRHQRNGILCFDFASMFGVFCKDGEANGSEERFHLCLGAGVENFPFGLYDGLRDVLECWSQRGFGDCAVGCDRVSIPWAAATGRHGWKLLGLLMRPCRASRLLFWIDKSVLLPGAPSKLEAIEPSRSSEASLEGFEVGSFVVTVLSTGFFFFRPVMLLRLVYNSVSS